MENWKHTLIVRMELSHEHEISLKIIHRRWIQIFLDEKCSSKKKRAHSQFISLIEILIIVIYAIYYSHSHKRILFVFQLEKNLSRKNYSRVHRASQNKILDSKFLCCCLFFIKSKMKFMWNLLDSPI